MFLFGRGGVCFLGGGGDGGGKGMRTSHAKTSRGLITEQNPTATTILLGGERTYNVEYKPFVGVGEGGKHVEHRRLAHPVGSRQAYPVQGQHILYAPGQVHLLP